MGEHTVMAAKENTAKDVRNKKGPLVIDTEMVTCVTGRTRCMAVAAQISIVDTDGNVVLHTYAHPCLEIVSYNTKHSGLTADLLQTAPPLRQVRCKITRLIRGRVLVGHAIENDLWALNIFHPAHLIVDTQRIGQIQCMFGSRTPGLKPVCRELLQCDIQTGSHCSLEDARATADLFMHAVQKGWL